MIVIIQTPFNMILLVFFLQKLHFLNDHKSTNERNSILYTIHVG